MQTPIGMGSFALTATAPYPAKTTRISHKGQSSTKNIIFKLCVFHKFVVACSKDWPVGRSKKKKRKKKGPDAIVFEY